MYVSINVDNHCRENSVKDDGNDYGWTKSTVFLMAGGYAPLSPMWMAPLMKRRTSGHLEHRVKVNISV